MVLCVYAAVGWVHIVHMLWDSFTLFLWTVTLHFYGIHAILPVGFPLFL